MATPHSVQELEEGSRPTPRADDVDSGPALLSTRLAGRLNPHDSGWATTLSQRGIVHRWRWADDGSEQSMHVLGAASSFAFSGPRLASILRPGLELEQRALTQMALGQSHEPVSQHTSAGGVAALTPFLAALQRHLPWREARDSPSADWFVNLQVEGSSAVFAAIDSFIQLAAEDDGIKILGSAPRRKIAVGACSYHGPAATSFCAATPLGKDYGPKAEQLSYPIPMRGDMRPDETEEEFHDRCFRSFQHFLELHAHELAVMLVEPQWGSARCAQTWPPELCRRYIALAQSKGIYVVCDEIMCGLGRHGAGTLFLSEAWKLSCDAVTFGKAIGGGIFPLSGVILRRGAKRFGAVPGRKVLQSHTYAGASARALMAAEATLNTLPSVLPNVAERGRQCQAEFGERLAEASLGLMRANGQGLLWGAEWTLPPEEAASANKALTEACRASSVWPYFVPKGFILTPVLDVEEEQLSEALRRLLQAIAVAATKLGRAVPKPLECSVETKLVEEPVEDSSVERKSSAPIEIPKSRMEMVASASHDSLVFGEPTPPSASPLMGGMGGRVGMGKAEGPQRGEEGSGGLTPVNEHRQ